MVLDAAVAGTMTTVQVPIGHHTTYGTGPVTGHQGVGGSEVDTSPAAEEPSGSGSAVDTGPTAPLLDEADGGGGGQGVQAAGLASASIPSSVINLANTIVGAGMLGLPNAFARSGASCDVRVRARAAVGQAAHGRTWKRVEARGSAWKRVRRAPSVDMARGGGACYMPTARVHPATPWQTPPSPSLLRCPHLLLPPPLR